MIFEGPIFSGAAITVQPNRRLDRGAYPRALRGVLDAGAFARARDALRAWPDYAPTPLHDLRALARRLELARIAYKDEGPRFGLGSFKALGAPCALAALLGERLRGDDDRAVDAAALAAGRYAERLGAITARAATDGNHGRALAWAARRFGCRAAIYVHPGVSDDRVAAIAAHGAEIQRVAGTYDDAVRAAAADARERGDLLVSDTSFPGYTDVPKLVMSGYGVMFDEVAADDAALAAAPPTHVFVQAGVGALAAAACAWFWERRGEHRPRLVVVEPESAACLLASARAGRPAVATGDLATAMAGLSCGEPSLLAWEILASGAFAFLAMPDPPALEAMRLLARGEGGDPRIVAGESGAAGLAALLCAATQPGLRAALELDERSRVLCVGTEGATDPTAYARVVGGRRA